MISDDPERWIGRRVGAYEILALLGAGGMGEVYRARRIDAQYDKHVAIKLVPSAYAAELILQRLRAERQILAKLDHPHIARLIDGGATEEGLPYLIMELVEGEPLDHYCEQRKLPIRERLRLFQDVCSAVTYAHQRLIVHRDLKPSNILVTADGTVKLLDFGIAKLVQPAIGTAGNALTITRTTTATPEFASPEQILNKTITTASDVYSLGVVLYLLLTGAMPYRNSKGSLHALMVEVCETEPPRPSAARGGGERLDGDLDAIVLRALRKEPEMRYRSIEELAEDIRCYLRDMPVAAREGQLVYRAAKLFRRHTLEISAAAMIVVFIVGGIVTSLRQAHLANEQRVRAERHFANVRKLAEVSMFELHDAIRDLPGATAARQLLVSTALQYLNSLAGEAISDRSLQHDLAAAYARVADIQGKAYSANRGNPTAAVDSYAKAIALLEPLVSVDPADASARNALAQSYLQQSRLLMLLGESKKGVSGSQRAVTLFEDLARANPTTSMRVTLADASRVHAMNLAFTGGGSTAIAHARRAIDILEDLHRERADDLELEYQLGMAYGTAGTVIGQSDPHADVKAVTDLHLEALAVDEHLVAATDGRNAKYARSLLADRVNLCSQFNDQGNYARAIEMCRAARPLLASLRTDTENAQIELDAASLNWNLGAALLASERLHEAEKIFDENIIALEAIARQSDTLQVQYLLAASEQAIGNIHARRATAAQSRREDGLRQWRLAHGWFAKAVPRFKEVASRVTLSSADRAPMTDAAAGLARSEKEIARLEGVAASPKR